MRICLALYLIASALAWFDKTAMGMPEVALRLVASVLILWKTPAMMWLGLGLAALVIAGHYLLASRRATPNAT